MIIDQLPLLGGDVQGTDEFPIERGTTTYKTTQAALIKPATDAAAAAQAAADDAQLAADNAQDTADEANEKGLPPGGTAGQVLTKADSSDYSASWEDPSGGGDVTADMLGIVITGSRPSMAASPGQYVIVRGSTITGITDGLYINSSSGDLSPSTDVTAADLTAVNIGGLNEVKTACTPIIQSISSTIPAGNNHTSVTAPTVSGYTFWYWLKAVSIGWIGFVYHEFSFNPTTELWTTENDSASRRVDSYAVYRKL